MEVIRAEAMGMCFGVRDALKVIDSIDLPEEVTVLGELVHNPVVIGRLDGRGFRAGAWKPSAMRCPRREF